MKNSKLSKDNPAVIISRYGKRLLAGLTYLMLALATGCVAIPSSTPPPNVRPQASGPQPPVSNPNVQDTINRRPVYDSYHDQPSPALVAEIDSLWRSFPGTTGIAVKRIDGGWTVAKRGDQYFPQQSVSKLWVVLTVLDMVDSGKIRLDERLSITRDDLAVFYQPIRSRVLTEGVVNDTILELVEQAIINSDNTANDTLLRRAGGPDAIRDFINRKNLGRIRFGPGERYLQSGIAGLEWDQKYAIGRQFYAAREELPYTLRKAALDRYLADPVDGASPEAIVNGLDKLARGELLSGSSTRLLLDIMSRTRSGPNRLKAGVPYGWQFLHKTGTGQDLPPVSTGYNDIGVMTAPDGTRYAVAVMLAETTASIPERMRLMQAVARAVASHHIP